jgi:hypothetical protein
MVVSQWRYFEGEDQHNKGWFKVVSDVQESGMQGLVTDDAPGHVLDFGFAHWNVQIECLSNTTTSLL